MGSDTDDPSSKKFPIPPEPFPDEDDKARARKEAERIEKKIPPEPFPDEDDKTRARKEEEDIEKEAKKAKFDHIKNSRDFSNETHKIAIYAARLAAGLIALAVCTLFWHYMVPESWLFLSEERFSSLKDFLLTGSLGAFLSRFISQFTLRPPQDK